MREISVHLILISFIFWPFSSYSDSQLDVHPLYIEKSISSKITAYPIFTTTDADNLIMAGIESTAESASPILLKINPQGQLIWKKSLAERLTPSCLASSLNEQTIVGLSSHNKKKNSPLLFLDKNGKETARWEKPNDSIIANTIVDVQSNAKGEAAVLFSAYNIDLGDRTLSPLLRDDLCAAIVQPDGKQIWSFLPDKGFNLFNIAFQKGIALSGMHMLFKEKAYKIFLGYTPEPYTTPHLSDIEYNTLPPKNLISAPETNDLFYLTLGGNQSQRKSIKRVDLSNPSKPIATTIYDQPSFQLPKINPHTHYEWFPKIIFSVIALPQNRIAVLDGISTTRLQILDSTGKILATHEFTGKGIAQPNSLFYNTKTDTIHVLGYTAARDPQEKDISIFSPSLQNVADKTLFWLTVKMK